MSARAWTETEFQQTIDLHVSGWSAAEIGKALGRSDSAVRLKLIGRGYSSRAIKKDAAIEASSDVPPKIEREEAERLVERRERRVEDRREQRAAMESVLEERLVEILQTTLRDCVVAAPIAPPPLLLDRPLDEATSAVLLIGDLHIGKVCRPAETEGNAYYNPAVALARLHALETEVARLLASGPPVEDLTVVFLGDIIEGILDHHAEKEETLLLSQQFSLAIVTLSQVLMRLPAPAIRVYGVAGNHGRWPSQKRMPTTGRESNFDRLVYCAVASIINASDATHIEFELRDSSRQQIEVRQTLLQVSHGDQFRGGEFCFGGLKREAFNSALRMGPRGQMPDLFILGDKHITAQLPLGNSSVLINGSLVGEDVYGQRFAPTTPSQTLFWVSEAKGKFLQADIGLEDAELPRPLPYVLSETLQQLIFSYL